MIAAAHAILWPAALSLAAYSHLDQGYSAVEALFGSTLMAYCAYVCESGLVTRRVSAAAGDVRIDFRKGWMAEYINGRIPPRLRETYK